MKKCKVCQIKFQPRFNSFQPTCENASCLIEFMNRQRHHINRLELKAMRDRAKTLSDWKRELRVVFHRFVRLRDRDRGCISCGNKLVGKYDAGHFYSRGAFPNLAFDIFNVHAQCVRCNQHLSGNLIEYAINLPKRIGEDEFIKLRDRKNEVVKLTIPQIRELIKEYKFKIKSIQ